jgi:hypothetical protein
MVLDPNLLENARTTAALLAEADRQALLARADYHTAVRRLHLGGASLREIADALSISYQRVQQIVSAAGGSWWQRLRARQFKRDAVCSWCGHSPSEVSKLIAGPNVFICDACVAGAAQRLAATPTSRARCGFCRKKSDATRTVVAGVANICSECLRICSDILEGRAA